ncbi:MAG: hypoxanthine phosphoribosyltransferase [Actinomycetota bacterium]
MTEPVRDDELQPLFAAAELRTRVAELGAAIGETYTEAPDPPVLVGILKGCAVFLADLARAIPLDIDLDFMAISSYNQDADSSGVVRIVMDVETDVANRDVVIVEDIVDTGLTLNFLRQTLLTRRPRTLRVVTLLDKKARRILPIEVDWSGFEIGDLYVLGYGIDHQGRYRNLDHLVSVTDLKLLASEEDRYVPALFPVAGVSR